MQICNEPHANRVEKIKMYMQQLGVCAKNVIQPRYSRQQGSAIALTECVAQTF